MPHRQALAPALRIEYRVSADELAGRPRLARRVEESPDFREQGDC
jgi:hypothetical protein